MAHIDTIVSRVCECLESEAKESGDGDTDKDSIRKDLIHNLKLVYVNSFGLRLSLLDSSPYALAVFSQASLFNHSCAANCHYFFEGFFYLFINYPQCV